MNRQDIAAIVRTELVVAAPDVPPDADEAADFRHDLGIDSLALLEFVARLEFEFGLAVPDDVWPRLVSIAAVVDYLSDAHVSS